MTCDNSSKDKLSVKVLCDKNWVINKTENKSVESFSSFSSFRDTAEMICFYAVEDKE